MEREEKKHFAELIKITQNGYSMIYKQTEIDKMVCKKDIQLKKYLYLYMTKFLKS